MSSGWVYVAQWQWTSLSYFLAMGHVCLLTTSWVLDERRIDDNSINFCFECVGGSSKLSPPNSANGRGVCLFFFLFAVDPNDITNINSRLNAWDFTEIHSFNNFDVLIRKQNGCYSAFIEYIITECGWHAMKWIATILRTCEKWSKLNQLQYSKVCMHCIWLLYNQMTSRFRN